MVKPDPQLPHGVSTTLGGLHETFAFHSSPESFITSHILAAQLQDPDVIKSRATVRAKILNRDVAIVSSHAQIQHVLASASGTSKCPFVAKEAYNKFMGPFYPSPNLLLADGDAHEEMRTPWEETVHGLSAKLNETTERETLRYFGQAATQSPIDLYSSLKAVCWRIILAAFLDLDQNEPDYARVQSLQEDLLRGQFSLLPVSINLFAWHSPRKTGIDAKAMLYDIILHRLETGRTQLPGAQSLPEKANHLLLFTSSLAVKGLSSMLLAYLVNVFVFRRGNTALVDQLRSLAREDRTAFQKSILLETERLSPPIVGAMRRVTCETLIPTRDCLPDIRIPEGWDIWLYFVGAGRDAQVFGSDCDHFVPERYLTHEPPQGFAFSGGTKTCLGQGLVRDVCMAMTSTLIDGGFGLEGEVRARGVQAWLGWVGESDVEMSDWTKDLKQLPTQHPAEPLMVRVTRGTVLGD